MHAFQFKHLLQYNFRQLPAHHKALLTPQQQDKFAAMRDAIEVNRFFIQSMLMAFDPEAAEVSPAPEGLLAPPPMRTCA